MLSIALPGCARHAIETTPPPPIVVTVRDRPPSDLLVCPAPPTGVPAGTQARIPKPARNALIRLALAYRAATDQLARLINWHDPAACPPPGDTAPRKAKAP